MSNNHQKREADWWPQLEEVVKSVIQANIEMGQSSQHGYFIVPLLFFDTKLWMNLIRFLLETESVK